MVNSHGLLAVVSSDTLPFAAVDICAVPGRTVMPTPDRTSLDAIVQAGRDILESAGVSGLTMQAVAERVGVRAPSLYKRVRNRDELVRLVVEATVRDLGERLEEVGSSAAPGHDRLGGDVHGSGSRTRGSGSGPESSGSDPRSELVELARAFRDFAHARPVASQLIFAPKTDEASPAVGELAKAVAPVLRVTATLAGSSTPSRPHARSPPGPTASSPWSLPAPSNWAAMWAMPSSSAYPVSPMLWTHAERLRITFGDRWPAAETC